MRMGKLRTEIIKLKADASNALTDWARLGIDQQIWSMQEELDNLLKRVRPDPPSDEEAGSEFHS